MTTPQDFEFDAAYRGETARLTLAKEISAAGGTAETAQVDALDEEAVTSHLDTVVDKAEKIDISFSAIGIPQQGMQGIPFTELSVESFSLPITTYARAHFVTGRAAARHMILCRAEQLFHVSAG